MPLRTTKSVQETKESLQHESIIVVKDTLDAHVMQLSSAVPPQTAHLDSTGFATRHAGALNVLLYKAINSSKRNRLLFATILAIPCNSYHLFRSAKQLIHSDLGTLDHPEKIIGF